MKIFLMSVNTTVEPYAVYPLGMAVVAEALTRAGHEVRQFDHLAAGESVEALAHAVTEFSPDLVGLSLRNIDNVDSFAAEKSWYLARARNLVSEVRKATGAPVMVGGPAFSIMPGEILDYLGADFGIVGEGERAVCEAADLLARGESPPRLTWPRQTTLGADEMLPPRYQRDLVDYYMTRSGMVNVQTKRGCPHRCSYCTYPSLEGRVYRVREPGAVADDLERLSRDFGVDHVFFTDSVFNDVAGHYLPVVEELIRRKLDMKWSAFFRPQRMEAATVRLLRRSGLHAAEVGTDAACDATLEGFGKEFDFDTARAFNDVLAAEGVPAAHFVMFGGPGETMATVRQGLANLDALRDCIVFAFSGIRILPGTRLLERAVADGLIKEHAPLIMPAYYFSPDVDRSGMNAMLEASLKPRRDRIFPPEEGQKRMEVMNRFGYKGLLWDHLLTAARGRKSGRTT